MDSKQIHMVRIPDDVYKELAVLARTDERSVNSLVILLIKRALSAYTTPIVLPSVTTNIDEPTIEQTEDWGA